MRRFSLLTLGLIASLCLTAAACSNNDSGDAAARSSNDRESAQDDSASSDSGSSDSGADIEDDLQSLLDEAEESVTSLLDEADEALGGVGECVDSYRTFGRLQTAILQGPDGATQAREAAEELKQMVPEELADDVDVIADALAALAEEGGTSGSTALSSPEYEEAMRAVNDYLMTECGLS